MKRSGGMTLIELLTVLAILVILTGIAVPAANRISIWRLRAAAVELTVRIRETRHTAIAYGENCNIIFFMFDGMYKLEYPDKNEVVRLPEGISFSANNFPVGGGDGFSGSFVSAPILWFRYTGAPNRGGHVVLRDKRGNKLYVIVTPVTGRVRIDNKPPK